MKWELKYVKIEDIQSDGFTSVVSDWYESRNEVKLMKFYGEGENW